MELKGIYCRKCGSNLKKEGELYVCAYCGAEYSAQSTADYAAEVKRVFGDALAEQKEEQIANIRRNLYAAVHEKYTDSAKIVGYCRELKKLLPDDFQANFFDVANSGSPQALADFILSADLEKNVNYLGDAAEFLINSLKSETLNIVSSFIGKLGGIDIALHAKYAEAFDKEAEKVEDGIYDVTAPRDVFVAYRSTDMAKVVELVRYLEEEEGLSCFVSYRNLQHGRGAKSNYDEYLKKAMDSCKVLVFVSSATSRAQGDARKKELPYIQSQDLSRAPAEFSARGDYKKIPAKYKKPRVEYIIEGYRHTSAEAFVKTFFDGFTYRETPKAVAEAVFEILDSGVGEAQQEVKPSVQEKFKYCLTCGAENTDSVKYCRNCGNDKFVPTQEEYLKIKSDQEAKLRREKAKREEAERKKREQEAADRARAKADEAERARRQKEKKKADKKQRSAARRQRAGEVLGSVGEGIGSAFSHIFDIDSAFGGTMYIITSIATFGLGLFNLIWPFMEGNFILLQGFSLWPITMSVFAVLVAYNFIFRMVILVRNDFETGIAEAVIFFVNLAVCGICVLIGYFNNSMWPWTWVYVAIGGFVALIAGCCLFSEDDHITDAVHVFMAFAVGICVCATMYVYEKQPDGMYEDFYYYVNDNNTLTVSAYSYEESIEFPDEIGGRLVTTIAAPVVAAGNQNLKNVVVPEGIITIDAGAFKDTAIENITLPKSLATIGDGAFMNCSLTEITLPEGLVTIGPNAFMNSSVATVGFPETLTSIGPSAFANSLITEADLPDSMTKVDEHAFENCSRLTLFHCGSGMRTISSYAFKNCVSLTDVYINDDISTIDEEAFANCSRLKDIFIPERLWTLGINAFNGCPQLTIRFGLKEHPGFFSAWSTMYTDSAKVLWGQTR